MKPAKSAVVAFGVGDCAITVGFQPATAASSRSIRARAPIGLVRKSTAPAFIAATAVLSDPLSLVAISENPPRASSGSRVGPPIVARSASRIESRRPPTAATASS